MRGRRHATITLSKCEVVASPNKSQEAKGSCVLALPRGLKTTVLMYFSPLTLAETPTTSTTVFVQFYCAQVPSMKISIIFKAEYNQAVLNNISLERIYFSIFIKKGEVILCIIFITHSCKNEGYKFLSFPGLN